MMSPTISDRDHKGWELGTGNWELGTGNWELGTAFTDPRYLVPDSSFFRFQIPGHSSRFQGDEMKDHKELDVWKISMDFVVDVYAISKDFPKDELYGLTSQLRRAAVSIPSNISEGAARNSEKEFIQFLHVALGSAAEAETQLIIAQRLDFSGVVDPLLVKIETVKKLISGLIKHYKSKQL